MSLCSSSFKREHYVKNSAPRCFFSSPRGHVSQFSRLCHILVVFLFCVHFTECHPWKYDSDEDDADKDWEGLCDSGRRQSPVDLTKRNCVTTNRIEPIAFIHYNRPVATNMTNNGHTVVLKLDHTQKEIGIAAGGLYEYYILDSVHFHWGGSEHTFNGHRLNSEIHFVHYNSRFDSLRAAKDEPRGLAVVAVVINKTTEDNPILDPLIASLGESVDNVGDAKTLEIPLSPEDLLPTNRSVFYRYAGSLTTPPCSESVEWTVLYRTIGASERQLGKFRTVNSEEGSDIKYNYRPTQPQHDRKIFFVQSSQYLAAFEDDGSTASRISLAPWVVIVLMGFVFRSY